MMLRNTLIAFFLGLASASLAETVTIDQGDLTALDTDGDAVVSSDEFFEFATFAFRKMDTDRSATLSQGEVVVHLDAESFIVLDKNKDGSVSVDEFSQQMGADFNSADEDGNGVLN